jgi:hypothetical protein
LHFSSFSRSNPKTSAGKHYYEGRVPHGIHTKTILNIRSLLQLDIVHNLPFFVLNAMVDATFWLKTDCFVAAVVVVVVVVEVVIVEVVVNVVVVVTATAVGRRVCKRGNHQQLIVAASERQGTVQTVRARDDGDTAS